MNLENRQQLLGLVAGTALAMLLGDRLVVTPMIKSWKERGETLVQLRKKVAQGDVLLGRSQSIQARWDSMRTNTLPRDASLAEGRVLKSFDRCSQDSSVSIASIRPQWKKASDDYATLECRVDASGNLSSLARFLYLLEKDPLGMKVDTLELSTKDTEGQQITLGLQVSALMLTPSGS